MRKVIIGITQSEARYENYQNWIRGTDEDIELVCLSAEAQNHLETESCDGIVFSGGADVFPGFYKSDKIVYPGAPLEFNRARDEFEEQVFEISQRLKIPVLGICRGMQLINVLLGGDLIQDLETSGKLDHKREGDVDKTHEIEIHKNTQLHKIIQEEHIVVNSAHHQAIGRIAKSLQITAVSPDGVPEAAERIQNTDSFLMLVQWHPERMNQSGISGKGETDVRAAFLGAVKRRRVG